MSKLQRHLDGHTHEWRLSETERADMRRALESHMRAHPLGGVVSPYSWLAFVRAPQFVMTLVVALFFSGTAYAAQSAVPGDVLYPVKIHVTEAVQGTLALTDRAKAEFNTKVAAERVREAQVLASEDRLSEDTTNQLEADYMAHASLAASFTEKVGRNDPVSAAQLHADFSALRAEGDVLAFVGTRESKDGSGENARRFAERTRTDAAVKAGGEPAPAVATLAMKTNTVPATESEDSSIAMQAMMAPVQSAAPVSEDGSPATEEEHAVSKSGERESARSGALGQLKEKAAALLAQLRKEAARTEDGSEATTSPELDARISDIEAHVAAAESASSDAEAFRLYQEALSAGATLNTFLNADRKFKGGVLVPLLRGDREE